MHAPVSSTQTNSDASYDSVGQGGEELVPGQIKTSQGVNNVSPGGLTQGIRALYYTALSNNPSVVSETPQNLPQFPWMSARVTRGCRTNNSLDH